MILALGGAKTLQQISQLWGLRQRASLGGSYLLGFQAKRGDSEERMGTEQDLESHFKDFSM